MARFKPVEVELSVEQQAVSDRIFERIQGAFVAEARRMADLMASKEDRQIFGQTEFELRDRVHALGAEVLEATAAVRLKKGDLSGC